MTWKTWGPYYPAEGEVFVGKWGRHAIHACQMYINAARDRHEVYLSGSGAVGQGPFLRPPDHWLPLPDLDGEKP